MSAAMASFSDRAEAAYQVAKLTSPAVAACVAILLDAWRRP
jgi:hypothetical protein